MRFLLYPPLIGVRFRRIGFYLLLVGAVGLVTMCWNYPNSVQQTTKSLPYFLRSNTTLLDLHNFDYRIKSDVCGNNTIFLVIVIHSATSHSDNRNTIRKTWASPGVPQFPVKTVFMLAEPKDRTQQRSLEAEHDLHHDIIQGNFIDSYRNLTYKHVMSLKWASDHCPQARFVIKMDDDIFVDIYQLLHLLQDPRMPKKDHRTIACYFQSQMPVVRDPASKWFVSRNAYIRDIFEDYCSGWAYVTNPNTAGELAKTASLFPYFWVDDVHITGQVATKAKVRRIRINQYFALETENLLEWLKNGNNFLWNKIFAPTWGDMDLMEIAHRKTKICYRNNCSCCYVPSTPQPLVPKLLPLPTGKGVIIKLLPSRLRTNVLNKRRLNRPINKR